jgi:hypothetical protein
MVEPHRMTDNLGGKTMALVIGLFDVHAAQSPKPELN